MPFKAVALTASAAFAHQQTLLGAAAFTAKRFVSRTRVVSMGHGAHASDNNPDILDKEKHRSLTGISVVIPVLRCMQCIGWATG
jgi:hypothetical protein